MKQWRREAFAINEQRFIEANTPPFKVTTQTARVQKNQRLYLAKILHVKGASGNWLLNGLLMRAGLLKDLGLPTPQSLPNVDTSKLVTGVHPSEVSIAKKVGRTVGKFLGDFFGRKG